MLLVEYEPALPTLFFPGLRLAATENGKGCKNEEYEPALPLLHFLGPRLAATENSKGCKNKEYEPALPTLHFPGLLHFLAFLLHFLLQLLPVHLPLGVQLRAPPLLHSLHDRH